MKKILITALPILSALYFSPALADDDSDDSAKKPICGQTTRLKQVVDNGTTIILNDGSIWEIGQTDSVQTQGWGRGQYIIPCKTKLINTTLRQSAKAEKERDAETREVIEKENDDERHEMKKNPESIVGGYPYAY